MSLLYTIVKTSLCWFAFLQCKPAEWGTIFCHKKINQAAEWWKLIYIIVVMRITWKLDQSVETSLCWFAFIQCKPAEWGWIFPSIIDSNKCVFSIKALLPFLSVCTVKGDENIYMWIMIWLLHYVVKTSDCLVAFTICNQAVWGTISCHWKVNKSSTWVVESRLHYCNYKNCMKNRRKKSTSLCWFAFWKCKPAEWGSIFPSINEGNKCVCIVKSLLFLVINNLVRLRVMKVINCW